MVFPSVPSWRLGCDDGSLGGQPHLVVRVVRVARVVRLVRVVV